MSGGVQGTPWPLGKGVVRRQGKDVALVGYGVVIALVSMLGEYMVRTLRQVTDRRSYLVADKVDGRA